MEFFRFMQELIPFVNSIDPKIICLISSLMQSESMGYFIISIKVEKNTMQPQIMSIDCAEWEIALTIILEIDFI